MLELKLLIAYSQIRELENHEIELIKAILLKYVEDHKYKSKILTKSFLYSLKHLMLNPILKGIFSK